MRIAKYDALIKLGQALGKEHGVSFVARIQSRKSLSLQINNGRTEEIASGTLEGMAVQVINPEGFMGFAAADQINETRLTELFEQAVRLAAASKSFKAEANLELNKLLPLNKQVFIKQDYPDEAISLSELEAHLTKLNDELRSRDPRLSVRTLLHYVDEEWRIFRNDSTDVSFNQPRTSLHHSITAKEEQEVATTYANLSGIDLGVLLKPESLNRFRMRGERAADLSLALLTAPQLPAGSYKLVIDYALAKGLAHEAFGHAAETDGLDSSILGEAGRLKVGMVVANPRLAIIDGPISGDYAYQPFSAVGSERQTVRIVDQGKLTGGLADIFSAAKAGVPPTGAERVESIFHLPIARMSNIRIEFADPIPINCDFEAITPADLYRLMQVNGLDTAEEKILFLSGFRGGQVNPAFGDFVFNCAAIYRLGPEPELYKPAIFSGKILSVLQSVSAALGPLQLDVIGTCGKMGQGVPSAGGSHYFLVIENNPEIMIGGE